MEETEKVKAQVDTWQKQIDECSTEDEKVQTIHDLIIQKVEYNHDLVNSDFATENTEYSQSVYSVLCTNKTVCAGYAQTFEMMCNGTGIDTVAVTSFDHSAENRYIQRYRFRYHPRYSRHYTSYFPTLSYSTHDQN